MASSGIGTFVKVSLDQRILSVMGSKIIHMLIRLTRVLMEIAKQWLLMLKARQILLELKSKMKVTKLLALS